MITTRQRLAGFKRKSSTALQNRSGSNLIDVVLAMFVACFAALTVCSLVITSASANRRASDELIAANAARQEIEIIRTMDSSFLTNCTDAPLIGSVTQLSNLTQAKGTLTVSDYNSALGLKQVTVKITWYTRNFPVLRSLSLTTLVLHNGVGT